MEWLRHPPLLWAYALRGTFPLKSSISAEPLRNAELERFRADRFLSQLPVAAAGMEHPSPSGTFQSHACAWLPVPLPSWCPRGEAMARVAQS